MKILLLLWSLPAGSVHLPGLEQAQGTPGCHVPAPGMLQSKGQGRDSCWVIQHLQRERNTIQSCICLE